MMVHIENGQDDVAVDSLPIQEIARAVVSFEGQKAEEVAIHFVDDRTMREIHEEFFHDSSSTDCMSFPIDSDEEDYRILGDVVICPETARRYVEQHPQHLLQEEIILYLVHGLLHLLGYRDTTEEEEMAMRAAESKHLAHLQELGFLPNKNT